MVMFIPRKEAVQAIGPDRLKLLRRCVDEAWETYDAAFREHIPVASPVGMANALHELLIEKVRRLLTEEDGFRVLDNVASGRFLVIVDESMILQFRKLTQDLLTRNNPTETSEQFDEQQPGIDGIPDLPRLTVGYQLGQYATEVAGRYLAFNIGKENVWYQDLDTGEHSLAIEFPGREGPSPADQERKEERRRKAAETGEEEVGGMTE